MDSFSLSGSQEASYDLESRAKFNSENWNSPNSLAQISFDLVSLVSEVGRAIAYETEISDAEEDGNDKNNYPPISGSASKTRNYGDNKTGFVNDSADKNFHLNDLNETLIQIINSEKGNVVTSISNKDQCDEENLSDLDELMSAEEFLKYHETLDDDKTDDVDIDSNDPSILISKYSENLKHYYNKYSTLNQRLQEVTNEITRLECLRQKVCEKTDSLDLTSRNLVTIQNEYQVKNEAITDELKFFVDSRIISERILSQRFTICSNEYYEILGKIEKGIDYMKSKPHFLEVNTYLTQYEFALSVVLAKTKIYVINALEQMTAEMYKNAMATATTMASPNMVELSTGQSVSNYSNQSAELDPAISFYYGKFQALSYKIQPLIRQLEMKSDKFKECEKLLDEIQQIYMEKRYDLMNESVANSVRAVAEKHKRDRSLLFRTSCSLFLLLCHDEHQLYYVFFSRKSDKLQKYLTSICSHLYDTLRPFIVQIEHIEILCELCTILKHDVLVNVDTEPEALEAFGDVVLNLLRDIQERLVFRANVYFNNDILRYDPNHGDLDYPDILYTMKELVANSDTTFKKDTESELSYSTSITITDLQGMWYPTVKRTLQCLSRLYRCVDVQTFQGLSQEAIKSCVISIIKAGEMIKQRQSQIDGDLFQIQHLLILREQITTTFHVDFTVRETALDFSKVREAARKLIQPKKLFQMDTNNAVLRLLLEGTPQIREYVVDSKKEIDIHLKVTCQSLIDFITKELNEPLQRLITQFQEGKIHSKITFIKLRTNPWASPEHIATVVNEVKRTIKSKIIPIQQKMTLYINNRETEAILFRPIKNNIIGAFVQLEQLLSECLYEKDELLIIGCPTAEQVALMLSSATLLNAQVEESSGIKTTELA